MEISHESGGYEGRFSDLIALVRDVVRRRWLTLAIVSATIFALAVVGIFMMTPKYTSEARVQIDPTRNPLSDNGAQAGEALTPEAIETEVSLINSIDLARQVVTTLKLQHDPELTKGIAPDLSPDDRETAIANALLKRLNVSRDKLTFILTVKYTSTDAIQSAQIANAFANLYVQTKVGSSADTAGRQADWFHLRLDALGKQVSEAEANAAAYRAKAGMVADAEGHNIGTIADQQVGPLSSQLASALSDAAAAHAKLSAARAQMAHGGIDSISEVLGSPVISDLRRQRAEVLRNVQEVQARYGDKHPESIRVHDQLDAIDKQITDEANRVVGSLQASAAAADASVGSLHQSMSHVEAEQAINTKAAVQADTLEREAKTKQDAYDRMSQLSMTSTEASKNPISSAEVITAAQPLTAPSSPNKPLLIAAALVIALGVGAAVIAVQEMMVTGLQSVDEVGTKLGMPVLAAIPKLGGNTSPADMLLDKPTSLFSESLRIARAAILGVRNSEPRRVIAITSALPAEGKTTTALAFARTLAINNQKTLLIECDVRRAQMRFLVGTPPKGPGIVEVLHGDATVAEAITAGDVPNLDHLLVREPYFSSEDLFGADKMSSLIEAMRSRYEMIVLDLPPLVGLADGRFLAVHADATVLCLKWNATPADAAASALGWLKTDGANPIGVIFTMVDSSAEAIGGLYYSKKYSAYYQAA